MLARIVPDTSNLYPGAVVPIPTFPVLFHAKEVLLPPRFVPNAPSENPNTAIPSVGKDPSK